MTLREKLMHYTYDLDCCSNLKQEAITSIEDIAQYMDEDELLHHSRPLAIAYLALTEDVSAPVVHGRWEWFDEETGTPITGYEREWGWRCSHCGEELPDDYDDPDHSPMLRFCHNCGAKMDGGDSDAKSV